MTEIVFASTNEHKLYEIKAMLPENIRVIGMNEAGVFDDIPETGSTLRENALLKAQYIQKRGFKRVLADDTGLEIHALGGAPGVYSARYAGQRADSRRNIEKVLAEMTNIKDRQARFVTVLCYVNGDKTVFFDGEVRGRIALQPIGRYGFGYDPIFIPEGSDQTFAQMSAGQKNLMSHRKRALDKFLQFIKNTSL